MRQVVAAEFGIELVQLTRLFRAEWPPVGPRGEAEQFFKLERFGVDHRPTEGGGTGLDRHPHQCERLHEVRPVLRDIAHDLLVDVDQFHGLLADEEQLLPESIQFFHLGIVEHQPLEFIVLPIEEIERDHLVDRHDPRVAEGLGEEATEVRERVIEPLPQGRALAGKHRHRRRQARGHRIHTRTDVDLKLHARVVAGLRMDFSCGDKLAARGEFSRDRDIDRERCLHAEILGIDGGVGRQTLCKKAEELRIDAHAARLYTAGACGGDTGIVIEFDAGQQRAGRRQKHASQPRIGRVFCHIGAAIRQQPLELGGERFAFFICGRRHPPDQQRSGWSCPVRGRRIGLWRTDAQIRKPGR